MSRASAILSQWSDGGDTIKTDVISISSSGNNTEAVLAQIDKVVVYKELSPKNAMALRLLSEEMTAMMRAIAGNVNGEFWVEDHDDIYELHLLVRSLVDDGMRSKLLSVASNGKNEASRGLMGKIRSFFEPARDVPLFSSGFGGGAPQMYEHYSWSLEDYRDQLRQYREMKQDENQAAWDELEKSVVAKVADDVKISIQGRTVEMTIIKKLI